MKGWFKKQQGAEYKAHLAVNVAVIDANGNVLAMVDGNSSDSRTSPQGATDAEKQLASATMVKSLFNNLDREMLPRLRDVMAKYARPLN